MKGFLALLTLLTCTTVYGQNKCAAIINWKYLGPVNIYDKAGGKVIDKIKNDSITEEFIHFEILNETDTYFNVSVSCFKASSKAGWIKKADYIGAYVRHEKFPMDVILYKFMIVSDVNKIIIKDWTPELLTIKKCAGAWSFVSVKQNKITYEGWIENENLCANAYAYCN